MRNRFISIALAILSFLACILIVRFFGDYPFIRGFLGDIVVVILVYFFVKSFYDFNPMKLAIGSVFFAYVIEFAQLLNLLDMLGLRHNLIARIVLGSTFDVKDLLAYTIGGVFVYLADLMIQKKYM